MNLQSNSKDSKPLLVLKNINLAYDLHLQKDNSLKDVFVNFFKNPMKRLFTANDVFHCLKGISFSIREGDRIAILGKNGSGKTSLCNLITGNFGPTFGEIERGCEIRCVYSSINHLFPELTGRENAKIIAKLIYSDLNSKELEELTNEAIHFSEINDFIDVPIKNYSKGMSTRLTLSLVTARPAELLIMDELFDGADQFFMEKFNPRLEKIINDSKSSIFISHNRDVLQKHCNRGIVVQKGEVVFDGPINKAIFYYQNSK